MSETVGCDQKTLHYKLNKHNTNCSSSLSYKNTHEMYHNNVPGEKNDGPNI